MRIAEITTRIVRVVEVPRSQLADFLKTPEAQQVGVYFLLGDMSDAGLPRCISANPEPGTRLAQHNQSKDFWNRALIVISLTNSLTQTHALFLEWFAIAEATKAARFSLENGNTGTQPYTPAPLQADCHEIHETAALLLATLGQPIFEPLTGGERSENPALAAEPELFYCKGLMPTASGNTRPKGLWCTKARPPGKQWSPLSKTRPMNAFATSWSQRAYCRHKVSYLFTRDFLFSSPSMAAITVLGRSANGWLEWKTRHGQTLDGLRRQPTDANHLTPLSRSRHEPFALDRSTNHPAVLVRRADAGAAFRQDAQLDAAMGQRFGALLEAGARGELSGWRVNAAGRLAEIVLLDQFSRNIYRDTPQALPRTAWPWCWRRSW
jgi:hypothetical protein